MNKIKKNRHKNIMIFLCLFFVEVYIALYVHDNFVRPFIGDVLVVILLFYFVKIFYTKNTLFVILGIFIFACGIEFLQFLEIVKILKIENKILKTAIGTVFDWKDIYAYGFGCVVLIGVSIKEIYQGRYNEREIRH